MADIIFPGEATQENLGATWLPKNVDLRLWQGDKIDFVVRLVEEGTNTPINLSSHTAQAVIKEDFEAVTSYSFTCSIQGVDNNEVRVYMPSSVSETIPAGEYVWNLQLTDAQEDVRTYLAGDVIVYAQVD